MGPPPAPQEALQQALPPPAGLPPEQPQGAEQAPGTGHRRECWPDPPGWPPPAQEGQGPPWVGEGLPWPDRDPGEEAGTGAERWSAEGLSHELEPPEDAERSCRPPPGRAARVTVRTQQPRRASRQHAEHRSPDEVDRSLGGQRASRGSRLQEPGCEAQAAAWGEHAGSHLPLPHPREPLWPSPPPAEPAGAP